MLKNIRLLALIVVVVVMAACTTQTGTPLPNQEPGVLPDASATADALGGEGQASEAGEAGAGEPGAEAPSGDMGFEEITLVRSGGVAGREVTVTVMNDGTIMADDQEMGMLDTETMTALSAAVDSIDFAALQAAAPGETMPDALTYEITVVRDGQTETFTVAEGNIPVEVRPIIDALEAAASGAPSDDSSDSPDADTQSDDTSDSPDASATDENGM